MPPFSDDNVTEPFIPPPFVEEGSESNYATSIPSSFAPSRILLKPYEHDRPVIPSDGDYQPFYNEYHEPSLFHSLRLYRFRTRRGDWKHVPNVEKESQFANDDPRSRPLPSSLRIITWNVDLIKNVWQDRINGVLRHLQKVVESHDGKGENEGYKGDAFVVLLQEVTPRMLNFIRDDEWVRRAFAIVPLREDKWPRQAYYGNVTLVSKDLEVVQAQIVHFSLTTSQRTGLLVYVRMSSTGKREDSRTICIANTHLESLPAGEHIRPKQLEALAQLLKLDENIEGGVVAGDMNSISKADRSLARKLGLKDAWRQGDSDPEGFTWGYQSLEEDKKYPPARLDKILYVPKRRYKVDEPQRIGVGLKVHVQEGEEHWVSDHYGLLTTLHVVG